MREEYLDDGAVVLVGKDVEVAVGMRVRMREGLISHGVGTIIALCDDSEAGCCEVVWDSNQSHTRGLHVKLGNMHLCRVGKEGHHDLVLADASMCSDLTIVKHELVLQGRPREYLEVVRNCAEQQAVPMPQEHMLIDDGSTESSAAPRLDTDAAAPVLPGQAPTEPMDSADGGRGQRPGADAEAHDLLQACGDGT